MRMWGKLFLGVVLTVLLAASSCVVGGSSPNPRLGKLSPGFSIISTDSTVVNLSDFKGKPVFINFWAIRCPYCVAEMPFIEQVYNEYAAEGLVVLGIDNGESLGNVKPFAENGGYTYTMLLDQDSSVADAYGVFSIPASFFIDKNGITRGIVLAPFQSKEDIEKYIKEII